MPIFARHADFGFVQNELQCTVNNMVEWVNDNGFRFSDTKTTSIHFCRLRPKRTTNPSPRITINDTTLSVVKQHKILVMIFDKVAIGKAH
jgi:hypothetical protein